METKENVALDMSQTQQSIAPGQAIPPEQTIAVEGNTTVPGLFRYRCKEYGDHVAHREKDLGIWKAYSWNDYYDHACQVGAGLKSLGLERGQAAAILSEDNRYWLYCDMGIILAGGISTGVYTTDSASQLSYLINDSGAPFLFIENDEQLDKYLEARDTMEGIKKVIVFERDGLREFNDEKVIFLDELFELGKQYLALHPEFIDAEIAKADANDTLMLVYTSGTTGPPKGAMISHRNMLYQIAYAVPMLEVENTDEQLCFLPLCHIYERLLSVYGQLGAGTTVNFSESVDTIFDNMREVSPHSFAAVPRFWEKVYSQVQIRRSEATAIGRWAFDRAIKTGGEVVAQTERGSVSPFLKLRYRIWDFLVLSNLRHLLGMNRMRRGGSGAAPISPELLRWFDSIGVPLREGYGATESAGVISTNINSDNAIGTVGKALPGTEIKIADDGEILVRGPNVFQGYWHMPEKTAETISADGWLHTGDVGHMDDQQALTITGRLKDIIITAGGKNITPAEIESQLKFSPYVSDAIVIGDRRKYLSCLVMIDQENVEKYAQDNQIPFSDFASLCAATEVVELIAAEVESVNKLFARVEQIKEFRLIDVLLTAEDEELTPTMKLKRSFVEKTHSKLIDSMYAKAG
jgi:long-chain acyl-CoA synthetase